MISKAMYIGGFAKSKDLTPQRLANIDRHVSAVNRLMAQGMKEGVKFPVSPFTKNQISTDVGGFREQCCKSGSPLSAHKNGLATDLFDGTDGAIGTWLMREWNKPNSETHKLIEELGMYFEHPEATVGKYTHWSHWTQIPPASGKRFFYP